MTDQVLGDDLATEIELMQQELLIKRSLLDESRHKLQVEITEHKETKSNLAQRLNENEELRVQLEMSLKAAQNLELENARNKETMVKLQVETNSYLTERQQLLSRCYQVEIENDRLKNEVMDLKEQLKIHQTLQENYRVRQSQTESLVSEIFSKQELLGKEQNRLEMVCKEGLSFARKISEEANYQAKFVFEANASRIRMEEEMVRLITALKVIQKEKNDQSQPQTEIGNYLKEWKNCQREYEEKISELLKENKRLVEELNLATSQIEILLNEKK